MLFVLRECIKIYHIEKTLPLLFSKITTDGPLLSKGTPALSRLPHSENYLIAC